MPENPLQKTSTTREFRLSIQEHEDLTGKVCLYDRVVDRVVEHGATLAMENVLEDERRSVFSNGRASRMGRSSGTARLSSRNSTSMVRLSSRGSTRRSGTASLSSGKSHVGKS